MNARLLAVFAAAAAYVFTLTPGRAQFVPLKGTYYGLFFPSDGSWEHSSGVITISTTSRGSYSARLQRGWVLYRFSGHFDEEGNATNHVVSFFTRSLDVELHVDPDNQDIITGSVSDGTWVADMTADRAVFDGRTNISPDAGQYTMVLPGDFTSTNTPGGDSIAVVNVDKAGRLTVNGQLADGWQFWQSTRVSKAGLWPFYFPAYGGDGTLHGWLQLNGGEEAISGDVRWIKPRIRWDWFYPDGFDITVAATGSQYVRPASGTKIIDIDTGTVEFNGGNLNDGITNDITLDSSNRIHNLSANSLNLRFSLSNGSFRGSVRDPDSGDWIPFWGVVLQDRNVGMGVFPGWDQTGEVLLQGD